MAYSDSFFAKHFQKKKENLIHDKIMTANSSKIQAHDPAMCEYSCIIFIDFHVTLKRPGNLDSLFSAKIQIIF